MTQARVVIVGGGLAGHRLAYRWQDRAAVTLIDPKDHFEVPMAAPRMLVQPELADRALLPFADFLPRVKVVRGWATRARKGAVEVRRLDGVQELVPFDAAVVAAGSRYACPAIRPWSGSLEERRARIAQQAARVAQARRVLVVGGGPVGVEVAAELAVARPDLSVTLVHSGLRLLEGTARRASREALAFLECRGVEVHLDTRVDGLDSDPTQPGAVRTHQGELLAYDLRVDAIGTHQQADVLFAGTPGSVGQRGRVAVHPSLRVVDQPQWFAVGDVVDLPEARLGMWAGRHVDVVDRNLARVLADPGVPEAALDTYTPATDDPTMLVTLGPRWGTGHVRGAGPAVGLLAWWFKSRDLMVGRYRRAVGLRA